MKFFKVLLRELWIGCLLLPSWLYSEHELSLESVRANMSVIFHYHIEHKELTPVIVKRAFKIYIDQFDYDKSYLLKAEVERFLDLKDEEVQKIISNYHNDRFDQFLILNAYIEKSIERQRRIREQIYQELVLMDSLSKSEADFQDYSSTDQELRQKIRVKLCRWVTLKEGKTPFSKEKREKILSLYEKKVRRLENFYYTLDHLGDLEGQQLSGHYQALHILKAMTKSLDSHSSFYSKEEAHDLRTALKKQFHGIGIVLKESENGVVVSDLIMNGPAYLSKKIEVGETLISINGYNVQECCFEDVLAHLRGEEGTNVELCLMRKAGEVHSVTLKREKILLNEERLTYTYQPFADGLIGEIVLPSFYDNGEGVCSEKDLRDAIKDLKSKGTLYGLVIDLRENSGGFLTQAVKIAALFITKGIVVISKYSDGEMRYMRDLDARLYYQGPLVLLTSKASASAAEIVAQALQDYGVAIIVGDERTYGKGSMQYQTVTEEEASVYFKVTVGRYYTISGRSTQIEGVKADIVVPTVFSPFNIGERYLEHPIASDQLDIDQILNEKAMQKTFPKKYYPSMQIRETPWKKMLPILKANSEKRLSEDKNFQLFLKKIRGEVEEKKSSNQKKASYGRQDLQMKEAVHIVRDMIILSQRQQIGR